MSTSRSERGKRRQATPATFAHHSEREFAHILDFYQIEWEYEPRTFHLQWDAHGNAIESFAPDFYLPELDLFIELTTLRQSLVTKKNRKLRRLRALYPDINIKLFYNRDYRSLMSKYGLPLQPVGGQTTSPDQTPPEEQEPPSHAEEEGEKLSPE